VENASAYPRQGGKGVDKGGGGGGGVLYVFRIEGPLFFRHIHTVCISSAKHSHIRPTAFTMSYVCKKKFPERAILMKKCANVRKSV